MIDIFACAKSLHCRTRNCHVVANGIESNHAAVRLDLVLTSLKQTNSFALTKGTTDWWKIATHAHTKKRYNNLLTAALENSSNISYDEFNDIIHKAGGETALLVKSRCEDWFQFNDDESTPFIEERNQLLHPLRSSSDFPPSIVDLMCTQLQCLNKNV